MNIHQFLTTTHLTAFNQDNPSQPMPEKHSFTYTLSSWLLYDIFI